MTVAIGPCPEFFQNPGHLPRRRIGEAIAERLRASALLLGVPGVPIVVMLHPGDGRFFLFCEIIHGRRIWRCDRHVQVDAETVRGILRAYTCCYQCTPVSALSCIFRIAEPGHEFRPCTRDALAIPSGTCGFVGKSIAGECWAYDVERVGGITAMRGWIG